ncbi:hypothetical protein GOBAR_AA07759 [Gossypium barbadense]|uniref:Uncharacterized protein n=1 Tax=Gossypium barbadense TaxID=3634 RepID=A0A2P5YBA9_GOSBA|nr:hypothetical protein GOBAR_DD21321 [Gossypium barbadense]PPS12880.1 hypothetical protein GOBAR_AA07759 [Gossypium barbadense]
MGSFLLGFVSKQPPSASLLFSCLKVITNALDSSPSGRLEKPEVNIAMLLGLHPLSTDCIQVMYTGANTTMDSKALVQLSWSTPNAILFRCNFYVAIQCLVSKARHDHGPIHGVDSSFLGASNYHTMAIG